MILETAMIASAVVGGVSSYFGGQSAKRKAKRAGRKRRELLRKEADVEMERGSRLASTQQAGYGAAGVGMAGSPLAVQTQTFMDTIRNRERILAGAQIDYDNSKNQGSMYALEGIGGAISGLTQASESLLDWYDRSRPAPGRV